jgi:hypothetical protein
MDPKMEGSTMESTQEKTTVLSESDDAIPEMIERSQRAFRRDLDDLLKTHYRQWVAYHGDERVGFAKTQTELYQRCLSNGWKEDEFVVRSVQPQMPDDDLQI